MTGSKLNTLLDLSSTENMPHFFSVVVIAFNKDQI